MNCLLTSLLLMTLLVTSSHFDPLQSVLLITFLLIYDVGLDLYWNLNWCSSKIAICLTKIMLNSLFWWVFYCIFCFWIKPLYTCNAFPIGDHTDHQRKIQQLKITKISNLESRPFLLPRFCAFVHRCIPLLRACCFLSLGVPHTCQNASGYVMITSWGRKLYTDHVNLVCMSFVRCLKAVSLLALWSPVVQSEVTDAEERQRSAELAPRLGTTRASFLVLTCSFPSCPGDEAGCCFEGGERQTCRSRSWTRLETQGSRG